MPNWCENYLCVTGPNALEFYDDNLDEHEPLSFDRTLPSGIWGTKWEPDIMNVSIKDKNMIEYVFLTAWTPPTEWIYAIGFKYPMLTFELYYAESGHNFRGHLCIRNGQVAFDNISEYYRHPEESDLYNLISTYREWNDTFDTLMKSCFTTKDVDDFFFQDETMIFIEEFFSHDDDTAMQAQCISPDPILLYNKLKKYLLDIAKTAAQDSLYSVFMTLICIKRIQKKFIEYYYAPKGAFEQMTKLKFDKLKCS